MRIRPATVEDLPELISCMRRMHAESGTFNTYPFDTDRVTEGIGDVLKITPHHNIHFNVLATDGDAIVGFAFAEVVQDMWTTARLGSDHGFYIDQSIRGSGWGYRLAEIMVSWLTQNADVVRAHMTAGIDDDRAGRLMSALGLHPRGRIYGVEI